MSKPDTLSEVLSSPTKKIEEPKGPEGVLARLWRTIMLQRNMGYGALDHAIRQFMESARINAAKVDTAPSYLNTNNIRRELAQPFMTIKVFLKALRVLGATKITLSVTVYQKHHTSTHQIDVDLGDELFTNDSPNENA